MNYQMSRISQISGILYLIEVFVATKKASEIEAVLFVYELFLFS